MALKTLLQKAKTFLCACVSDQSYRPGAISACLPSHKPALQATKDKDTFYRVFISPAVLNSQKHPPPSSITFPPIFLLAFLLLSLHTLLQLPPPPQHIHSSPCS